MEPMPVASGSVLRWLLLSPSPILLSSSSEQVKSKTCFVLDTSDTGSLTSERLGANGVLYFEALLEAGRCASGSAIC